MFSSQAAETKELFSLSWQLGQAGAGEADRPSGWPAAAAGQCLALNFLSALLWSGKWSLLCHDEGEVEAEALRPLHRSADSFRSSC